jgi:hypothetical protein
MTVRVRIKENAYGMNYQFTIEDVDYSSYSAKLYVWKGDTTLIDGKDASVSKSGSDTVVTYTVADGDFDVVGEWKAEIVFYSALTFEESTETFEWEVVEGHPTS